MLKLLMVLVFLLASTLALAQAPATPVDSVTVTAARGANLQPDQVTFVITVTSGLDATLDDIVRALAGSGITAANFSSVSTSQVYNNNQNLPQTLLQWSFTLTAPLANIKAPRFRLPACRRPSPRKTPLGRCHSRSRARRPHRS